MNTEKAAELLKNGAKDPPPNESTPPEIEVQREETTEGATKTKEEHQQDEMGSVAMRSEMGSGYNKMIETGERLGVPLPTAPGRQGPNAPRRYTDNFSPVVPDECVSLSLSFLWGDLDIDAAFCREPPASGFAKVTRSASGYASKPPPGGSIGNQRAGAPYPTILPIKSHLPYADPARLSPVVPPAGATTGTPVKKQPPATPPKRLSSRNPGADQAN